MRQKIVLFLCSRGPNRRITLKKYADGDYLISTRRLICRNPVEIMRTDMRFSPEAMGSLISMWCQMNDCVILPRRLDASKIENVPLKHIAAVVGALGIEVQVELRKESDGK